MEKTMTNSAYGSLSSTPPESTPLSSLFSADHAKNLASWVKSTPHLHSTDLLQYIAPVLYLVFTAFEDKTVISVFHILG